MYMYVMHVTNMKGERSKQGQTNKQGNVYVPGLQM